MSAKEMHEYLTSEECGLLEDLDGHLCLNSSCLKGDAPIKRSTNFTLGAASAASHPDSNQITNKIIMYQSKCCRSDVAVNHGSPMYPDLGGGVHSVNKRTLAFWFAVEGASQTFTSRFLRVDEKAVQKWFDLVRTITEEDALARQEQIVFGGRSFTTIVEVDETVVKSYKAVSGIRRSYLRFAYLIDGTHGHETIPGGVFGGISGTNQHF